MDWEAILMDPIVKAAIIGVAGSTVFATLGGFLKIIQGVFDERKFREQINSKIDGKIGNTERGSLSKQHEYLENTITDKTTNLKEIILNNINNIDKKLNDKEKIQEVRYARLDDGQKRIEDSFKIIEGFREEWKKINEENTRLIEKIAKLEKENQILYEKNQELEHELENEWEM